MTMKNEKLLEVAAQLKELERRSDAIIKRRQSIDAERILLTEEHQEITNEIIKTQRLILQTALDQV
jgi:hypothetical protein